MSPQDPNAGILSPQYWASIGKSTGDGVTKTALRTVSSSGYRDTLSNKSSLMQRNGNLKDVNEVMTMFKALN